MAGSERIAVLKAIGILIDAVDEELYKDTISDDQYNALLSCSEKLWLINQNILRSELSERVAVTKTKTKALSKVANNLRRSGAKFKALSGRIDKVAKAVDKLVDLSKNSIDIAKIIAPIL